MIRKIIDETKCTIDIEDDGTVIVVSTNSECADKAIKIIERLTRDVERRQPIQERSHVSCHSGLS